MPESQIEPIVLGPFVAESRIADAANSSVYRGRHQKTNTDVAIKILRHDHEMDESRTRFQHEVRSTARILHPGIVRLFECGVVVPEQSIHEGRHP